MAGVDLERPLMKVIIRLRSLFVAITYGTVSLWLWKTRGIFFLIAYFVATHAFNNRGKIVKSQT